MSVELLTTTFDPYAKLHTVEQRLRCGSYGATASFIGTLRDFNQDATVLSMFLEHYPGMTEKQLHAIVATTREKWPVLELLVVHRVGEIKIGEPIVLTAAWAMHRDAAFAACHYLIETLKTDAPFWKNEQLQHGRRWLANNTSSDA